MTNLDFSNGATIGRSQPLIAMLDLHDAIDGPAAEGLRERIRRIAVAPRNVMINCASVQSIDPVGAALLWLLCRETERSVGTRIQLIDLPAALKPKLRSHPLATYLGAGQEMFQDPFDAAAPSRR